MKPALAALHAARRPTGAGTARRACAASSACASRRAAATPSGEGGGRRAGLDRIGGGTGAPPVSRAGGDARRAGLRVGARGRRGGFGRRLRPRAGLGPGPPILLALLLAAASPAPGQPPGAVITDIDAAPPTPQLDGLEWTFVRIRYGSREEQLRAFRARYWSDPWAVDGPAAEQNLSRRLGRVTSIRVRDPVVLTLADERLWEYPWIYFVEPGNLRLKPEEVEILREFLLRGGTATFDDFHGPIEFAAVQKELRRVFPDREIVKLPLDHPVFGAFYRVTEYPQIPGLGSFFNGVTWEKGGYEAELHAILDDDGRAMVLLNFNTDMGDGWEWSNAEDYPGYIEYTARAYRMMINEVVYALTH